MPAQQQALTTLAETILYSKVLIMGNNKTQNKNWWTTLPGVITAVATLITAIGGFVAIINLHSSSKNKSIASNDSSHAASTVIIKDSSKVEGVVGNISGKNVNVGSNYGHVGDEYNGVKQRKVTQELINKIALLSPNKKFPIGVYHSAIDPETLNFTNDLIMQLKDLGYRTVHTADMSLFGDKFLKNPQYILAYPDTILAQHNSDEFTIFIPAARNYY